MAATHDRWEVCAPRGAPGEEVMGPADRPPFPPLGKRSLGGGFAFDQNVWGNVPGGYRNTIKDNVVLILMIETLEGLKHAHQIAKVPGVHAVLAAGTRLWKFARHNNVKPNSAHGI